MVHNLFVGLSESMQQATEINMQFGEMLNFFLENTSYSIRNSEIQNKVSSVDERSRSSSDVDGEEDDDRDDEEDENDNEDEEDDDERDYIEDTSLSVMQLGFQVKFL